MSAERIIRDERGVALPMAMMVLVLLMTLVLAFAVLSETEPVIAHSQMRVTQARVQAEAGLERAVWALSQGVIAPGTPDSLPSPLPAPTPAPYDGTAFIASGATGGYRVTVTTPDPAGRPNERQITSIGWTPTDSAADPRTKSHRRIRAAVERLPAFAFDTPCALCVRGDLGVGGNALVDATTDLTCGNKKGALAVNTVAITSGSAQIRGADGNTIANQEGSDFLQNATDPSLFAGITLNAGHFKLLRELAKRNGTYFGPGYPNGTAASSPAWGGTVAFNSGNRLQNGIVFVDTVSGSDIPAVVADQNPADFASVSIHGNPFVSGSFSGWIIVNGSLQISGNMQINGLVYTVNDLTYNGTGTGEIRGLAVSQNIRDTTATAVSSTDTSTTGNSRVRFNCANLDPPSGAPRGFALVPGTYQELPD